MTRVNNPNYKKYMPAHAQVNRKKLYFFLAFSKSIRYLYYRERLKGSMLVYHGSNHVVKEPRIISGSKFLDFGTGFYTTTNKTQAERWAQKVSVRREPKTRFISIYEVDENYKNVLNVINFSEPNAEWLKFVCACRCGKDANRYYDMVLGPVANDNVYSTVVLFEKGVYDETETLKRLKIQPLYNQVLFHTEKALEFCKYVDFYELTGI